MTKEAFSDEEVEIRKLMKRNKYKINNIRINMQQMIKYDAVMKFYQTIFK
jgi:hypothetical protein